MIFYQAPWNWSSLINRAQPLARALACHTDVLYINLKPSPPSQVGRFRCGLNQIADRLWLFEWPGAFFQRGDIGVTRDRSEAEYQFLLEAILQLQGSTNEKVLLTSRPATEGLLDLVSWDGIFVDVEDPWWELPWGGAVASSGALARTLNRANHIFTNGKKLLASIQMLTSNSASSLPNGIDLAYAKEIRLCCNERRNRHPVRLSAGFTGLINERIEPSFLTLLVSKVPEVDFQFIGPVNFTYKNRMAWNSIKKKDNFYHWSEVPQSQIPFILSKLDILLLPYFGKGTKFMSPAKLLEYLCTGKPIVSSLDISDDYGKYERLINCRTREDFILNLILTCRTYPSSAPSIESLWSWDEVALGMLSHFKPRHAFEPFS